MPRKYPFLAILMVLTAMLPIRLLAQNPDMSEKISVNYQNTSFEEIISDLSVKTGIEFSYSPELIPVNKRITYNASNVELDEVLKDILDESELQYIIVNGYIVLKPLKKQSSQRLKKTKTYTLNGIIRDSANNEPLIGAAIYNAETGLGVITNNFGFYSLHLPENDYALQISYLGYQAKSSNVHLNKDITWNATLKASPVQMKEIIINSFNTSEYIFNSRSSQTNISPSTLRYRSVLLGEPEMLKSLETIPGISFQSDASSFFYVRGGNRDQNLILLDDAPIFNPTHLLGLFTPIIPEAIKHTEVYRGDFPIHFGGRISSVIDIRAKDGNTSRISGSARLSPVSNRFSIEGPLKKDASSFFLSFRLSTFGWLIKEANPGVEKFYFADINTKFNIRIGKRDRLFLTIFSGKDEFIQRNNFNKAGLEWNNSSVTLKWSHIYGTRLFSNTTLYGSRYNFFLYTNYDDHEYWNSDITGANLKTELTWYANPRNNLKFGLSAGGYFFNPGNFHSPKVTPETMMVSEVNSGEYIVYIGHGIDITNKIQINYGLRFTNWSNYGEAFSIKYDNNHQPVSYKKYEKGVKYFYEYSLEPRISTSFMTGKYASVKLYYNRTFQNIHQINNSISPLNSLEVWLPSGPNISPQYANIFGAGFIKSWPKHAVELNLEVYYKRMYNQIGYDYHAEMLLNPYLEGELRQGDGYAKGFEIMLQKTQGRFTGSLSYAYTRSILQFSELNSGKKFLSHQDKPVDLSLNVEFRITPRWIINVNTLYASGMVITTPSGFYEYRGYQVPFYTKQNNDRLPPYKRLDWGSTWRLNKRERSFEHYFNISFYNFLNFNNYTFLNFSKTTGSNGKYYIPADKQNMPEQITTFRYIYSIIPSFAYNLRF